MADALARRQTPEHAVLKVYAVKLVYYTRHGSSIKQRREEVQWVVAASTRDAFDMVYETHARRGDSSIDILEVIFKGDDPLIQKVPT